MKRYFILLVFLMCLLETGYAWEFNFLDSLGTAQKGNQTFIIHQVDAGETLFALSRKYNLTVQEIKDANTESLTSLNIGQKIMIPIKIRPTNQNVRRHIVKSSETLFSISRNYNVQVDDLKKWNNLSDNSISVGQELIIENEGTSQPSAVSSNADLGNRKLHKVEESQTLYAISRLYGITTDQIIDWNHLASSNLNIGQILIVSAQVPTHTEETNNSSMLPAAEATVATTSAIKDSPQKAHETTTPVPSLDVPETALNVEESAEKIEAPAQKVIQKGMAEVIADTQNTKKYLAMHRDAPIGTIMQVKNEMNNQTVFVRVVAHIPPTGDNDKIILMISKKAFDRLGAVDNRFPVEISFIP